MIISLGEVRTIAEGVSELIATVLLVSMVVIGAGLVATVFFSQPGSVSIPQVDILSGVNPSTNQFYLCNNGGDSLKPGTFTILVDTGSGYEDMTDSFTITGGGDEWSPGTSLVYDYSGSGASVGDISINIVFTGEGTETLISSTPLSCFVNETIWGNVTDSGVRPIITPVPAEIPGIIFDNESEIKDELEEDGVADIHASTTGGFVADRVDLLVYNHDLISYYGSFDVDDYLLGKEMDSDNPGEGIWYLEDFDDLLEYYYSDRYHRSDSIIEGHEGSSGSWWDREYYYEYDPTEVSFVVIGYNETTYESFSDSFLFNLQMPTEYRS